MPRMSPEPAKVLPTLSIGVAAFNSLEATRACWLALTAATVGRYETELIALDNGSTDGTADFLERYVLGPFWPKGRLLRNPENAGVIPSLNQIVKASTGDVVALLHNDLYVLEEGWDMRVREAFAAEPKVGLAGFVGAAGIGTNGGREHTCSNMLDAEHHGARNAGLRYVAVFDGLALIGRRQMFEQVAAGNPGGEPFDTSFAFHHFYDRDISAASLAAGWKNLFIGVRCWHANGQTANFSAYQEWAAKKLGVAPGTGDQHCYQRSERRFFEKWGKKLPIRV